MFYKVFVTRSVLKAVVILKTNLKSFFVNKKKRKLNRW